MAADSNIIQQIVRDERNDCGRNANKRKLSDQEEMWGWLLNSDDQNQEEVEETSSNSNMVNYAEIEAMFDKVNRRKKTAEKNPQDIGLLVEKVMALMEVAAEEDIELNRQNKPAIKKIQMLPLLTDFLSKKHLQPEFLDRGVLSLLKIWLEPLPDGSLPNTTLRASLLNILTHPFPIDISKEYRREQLKKSGLGKVIMFLSKSDEEITANRQLAKDLIENWSRIIFHKGTSFSDLRKSEEKAVIPLNKASPPVKKQSTMQLVEADLDLEFRPKQSSSSARSGVSVPEAVPRAYAVIPRTKSKPEAEVERARVRYIAQTDCKIHKKIEKKMRRMKNSNKKKTLHTPLISTCKAPI
ncbi:ARABIDOPSIS THALIANA IWS1 (FROM YEAST INTERACTS WITH SPT6), HIGH NITROGEN INSENSITIVE 9 [Hibiscus trionum]|uniref:ARABIDOPSIS THALIANA IWS1 (FROM YEAST INTERACTS WITH SPT6), HIGH NITROGEN INSENSITIVE 9 n=1 Tax=Hibiscus trionum TaxID=183268 RepID=A0A9W7LY52_HIBTR|nr:ARABIDOPSIS THALIANA IWS1 (FROM YEAST INTERACTS WITH SPT6), HIGH NITROGEN INSENSITIVE 9 [Hibiscus trionum]